MKLQLNIAIFVCKTDFFHPLFSFFKVKLLRVSPFVSQGFVRGSLDISPYSDPRLCYLPLHTRDLSKSKLLPKISKSLQGRETIYLDMPGKVCVYYSLITRTQKCPGLHNKLYGHPRTGQTPAVSPFYSCQRSFFEDSCFQLFPVLYCQLYHTFKRILKICFFHYF